MFKFPVLTEKYSPVAKGEETETFLSNSETSAIYSGPSKRRTSPYAITFLLVLSSLVTIAFGFHLGRRFPINLNEICTRHTTKYSPILEDINISYHIEQFNGSFAHENIYRQDAGPEVDAAWDALGVTYGPVLVPDSLATKSGLTEDHARRNPKYGGGYPVFLEGMHQLHCLNFIRKSLYYNYDYYHTLGKEEFSDSDKVVRWHVSHCLDFIRQRLMCTIDTGVFGSVWVGNRSDPHSFLDFNTKHVCRNFEEIREWAEENQLPKNLPKDFWEMPGEDVKVWELTP